MKKIFGIISLLCLSSLAFAWAWLPAFKATLAPQKTEQVAAISEPTAPINTIAVQNNGNTISIPASKLPEGFATNIALFKQTFEKMDGVRSIEIDASGNLQVSVEESKAPQVRNAFNQIVEHLNKPQTQYAVTTDQTPNQLQLSDEQMAALKMDMYKKYGAGYETHLNDYLQGNDKKRAASDKNNISSPSKPVVDNEK